MSINKKYPLIAKYILCFVAIFLHFSKLKAEKIEFFKDQRDKIEGSFIIDKITSISAPSGKVEIFKIVLRSLSSKGPIKTIFFETNSVHKLMKEGAKFLINAEVIKLRSEVYEAMQILVFFPRGTGHRPVWIVSHKNRELNLRGARFIDMHNPDFLIL